MYLGIYGDIVEKGNGGDVVMGGYNIKGELSKKVDCAEQLLKRVISFNNSWK